MRRFWLVLVVGCGGAPAPAIAPARALAPAPPITETIRAPRPEPKPIPGPGPRLIYGRGAFTPSERYDVLLDPPPVRVGVDQLAVSDSDLLSRCVRDFVRAHHGRARRAFITALAQYATRCDRDGRVVLEHPLAVDRHELAFTGTLSANRLDLSLRVVLCGGASALPDRIALVTDGERWMSSRLEFERDAHGCQIAELPYTSSLGRTLARVVDTADAVVRFEGTQLAVERPVSAPVRDALRVVLEALEARD